MTQKPYFNKWSDINKIAVSNKPPFDKKDFIYFIGYRDNKKTIPFCIFFPKVSAYRTDYDETECMYLMIKEKKDLIYIVKKKQYIKKINNEVIYSKKYLIAKKKKKHSTQKKAFNVLTEKLYQYQ